MTLAMKIMDQHEQTYFDGSLIEQESVQRLTKMILRSWEKKGFCSRKEVKQVKCWRSDGGAKSHKRKRRLSESQSRTSRPKMAGMCELAVYCLLTYPLLSIAERIQKIHKQQIVNMVFIVAHSK